MACHSFGGLGGAILTAARRLQDLPIYDDLTISKYRGRSAFDPKLPPHIFALADNVFSDMKVQWQAARFYSFSECGIV